MKTINLKILLIYFVGIFALQPDKTRAAGGTNTQIINPNSVDIATIITNVITWILSFTGALAILFILYSGIQYITFTGNPDKAKSAKSTLTYAIIGLIIVILANVIVLLIKNTISTGTGGVFGGTTTIT